MDITPRWDGKNPTIAAPHVILKLGGRPIGRGATCNVSVDLGIQPVPEIGEQGPQEFIPADYRCTVDLEMARIFNEPIDDIVDSITGRPIFPDREQVLYSGYTDIALLSKKSVFGEEKVIGIARSARCGRRNIRVSPGSLVGTSMNFFALGYYEGEV